MMTSMETAVDQPDRRQGHGRLSFAASLQPLDVSADTATTVFRTSGLIAATPHVPVNRKLVTDRCKSHVIARPRSSAAAAAQQQDLQGPQQGWPDRCATAPQPLRRAASPLFAREYIPLAAAAAASARRTGTPLSVSLGAESLRLQDARPGSACAAAVPPVLQFEGWWLRLGPGGSRQKCSVHISYHTDTEPAAFFIKGEMDNSSSREPYCRCTACAAQASTAGGTSNTAVQRPHTSSSSRPRTTMQATRSRSSIAATACSRGGSSGSCGGCTAVLPPEGAWLCVTGSSGQPLDHWDLHVGAELNLLGRKVVLKRAACATMAWLDAWAKLLLQHQSILEQQLAKFAPVVPGEGLLWHTPQRSDWSRPGTPLNPTGGRVNLRHLRESVAVLAARLRQHKADVVLPPELEELTPQGPLNWSMDAEPQVLFAEPFTPAPRHSSNKQLLQREYVRLGQPGALKQQLPSLGTTPGADRVPNNGASLWNWLQSIPLAASAAKDAYRGGEQLYAPRLQIQPQL